VDLRSLVHDGGHGETWLSPEVIGEVGEPDPQRHVLGQEPGTLRLLPLDGEGLLQVASLRRRDWQELDRGGLAHAAKLGDPLTTQHAAHDLRGEAIQFVEPRTAPGNALLGEEHRRRARRRSGPQPGLRLTTHAPSSSARQIARK
jgi:hypothetical protein